MCIGRIVKAPCTGSGSTSKRTVEGYIPGIKQVETRVGCGGGIGGIHRNRAATNGVINGKT